MQQYANPGGMLTENKLLAALPVRDWNRLQEHLSPLDLPAGKTLCEPHSRMEYAYFPASAIISVLHVGADGASTEIAMIGNEGLAGVSLVMGGATTPNRVMVQSKGRIYRLRCDVLREEFACGGALQRLLLCFTNALLTQISQAAVCNRRHSIDQQLCRWLLLSLDRLESEELTMTHEVLANTLGVRREGITEAARKLHNAGLINYLRGRITVIDRIGVEAYCCECYSVVRGEYDRLPGRYAYSLPGAGRPAAGEHAEHATRGTGSIDGFVTV